MFELLRRGAQTWAAKILLVLLVLSFGAWGVSGTMLNNLAGGNAVVRVGDVEVSPTQFRLAYDRQMASLSRQFGQRLTRAQAKSFGIENRVYSQLAAGAALDQLSRQMNLGLSQDRLARMIADDPAFQDSSGAFNRQAFSAALNNVGMSESDYIQDRSQAAVRSQVIDAVASGFKPPETLVNAILQHRNETRDVDYVLVSKDAVDAIEPPSDDELQAYFEDNKQTYAAPEYRKIVYTTLRAEDIADPDSVGEDQVRDYYETNKNSYGTAEKRSIDQLVFDDDAAAKAAAQKLDSGESFDSLVKAADKSVSDVELGTFTKEDFPDADLAEAAFSIEKAGGTTGVVDGAFGPAILRVSDIQPAKIKSFDAVKADIRKDLALAQANERLLDVHDAYEDDRAGGATLQEAAKKEGLKPVVVDAVDRTGKDPEGNVIKSLPESKQLLADAFESDEGVEMPSIDTGSSGYLWAEVLDVMPSHDRKLDAVRGEVAADWKADQLRTAIADKAAAMKKEVDDGKALAEVASDAGLSVEKKTGVKRGDDDVTFGEAAVAATFGGPEGHVATADDASGDNTIVLAVTAVNETTPSGYDSLEDQQVTALSQRDSDDIFSQMVAQLQNRYGVSVNQSLGDQAISY